MDPRDHIRITKKAMDLYLEHAGSTKNAHLFDDYRRAIGFGCWIEDVFPVRERLTRWHFFPENDELKSLGKRKALGLTFNNVDPTSRALCLERADQLARECRDGPSSKFFRLLGRVLHHVQDMSTPPHVVPVYHDPIRRDSYESYSVWNTKRRVHSVEVSAESFSRLAAKHSGSFEIYDEAAHATLALLYGQNARRFSVAVDGHVRRVGCEEFWKRCSQHQMGSDVGGGAGFGCYGALGKHFGKNSFNAGGKRYEVDPTVFEGVHGDLVQKAVEDSLRVLLFADAKLSSP